MSEHKAATVIGLPLIDPELSINSVTIVSLNSIFFSFLKDNLLLGFATILANLEVSRKPSSTLNSHCLFCSANNFLCSLFAIFIMLTGIGIIALFTGTVSSIFVTKKIREGRGLETVKITNHIIICGYNSNIEMILDFLAKLTDNDLSVVIINILHEDQVNSILSRYNKIDIKYVKGDHSREGILEKANVKNASSAIVLTDESKGDDQKTILCTLTIKNMNPDLRVIAQVSNRENITHLRRANVDEIIINDKFETFMTASHILDPGVPQAIYQLIDSQSNHRFQSKSIPSNFIGKSFDDLFSYFRNDNGWICVGIYTEEEKMGISEFLSADTSSLDAFIERKLKEAGHSMKQESKVSVLMNPKSDHIIKKGERAIIIP